MPQTQSKKDQLQSWLGLAFAATVLFYMHEGEPNAVKSHEQMLFLDKFRFALPSWYSKKLEVVCIFAKRDVWLSSGKEHGALIRMADQNNFQ